MSQLPVPTTEAAGTDTLYAQILGVLTQARTHAKRSVNQTMVQAYWQVGRLIVENEQAGQARAAYGSKTLQTLAQRLSAELGKGFSLANLRNFRQFYLTFTEEDIRYPASSELSWTHYRVLMRVTDPAARQWYAAEAVSQTWSVAALDRQISTLYYQRLLSSQHQQGVRDEASALVQRIAPPHPRDFIRDPYILEFLDGQPHASWYEKDLEQGLLDQLQKFLLELGKGFAFVARQRHLRVEDEDAFVDLVFYNYNLIRKAAQRSLPTLAQARQVLAQLKADLVQRGKAALALLVAESAPAQKEVLIRLIVNMLAKNAATA